MSARAFRLTAPVVREGPMHRQVADVMRLEIAPAGRVSPEGVVWFSIDMAAYSGVAPGLRTARGCVAGVPDMIVLYQGRVGWIELKSRDGTLSDPQRSMAATLLLSGCRIGVARDADECLRCLDEWEIPRAHRVRMAERSMRVSGS